MSEGHKLGIGVPPRDMASLSKLVAYLQLSACVNELVRRWAAPPGAQQGDPPPAADPPAAVEDPAGGDKAAVVASLPQLNPSLPAAWSAGAQPAVGAAPARLALPAVPDLRPELAALTFALNQQHAATAGALRQMVGLCQRQQQQIQWILREIETLTQRLNRVPYC